MIGPLGCLILGVALILFLILYMRFHAFLAMIIAAIVVAFVSDRIPMHRAIPLVAERFGVMMGQLGILLILAAIIGKCLMDSGAAERIVRAFTRVFGKEREHHSLFASSFVLGIPVFFDTVFYLLAPLARAVYARRKRDYILIVCAVAAGGALTHGLIPPTPGPLAVAEQLEISIVVTILVGLLVSIVPAVAGGVFFARWINKRMTVTPKDALGVSQQELEIVTQKDDRELPNLLVSLLPFVLPVVLLAASSTALTFIPETITDQLKEEGSAPEAAESLVPADADEGSLQLRTTARWVLLLGDKNLCFLLGALISIWMLFSQKKSPLKEQMLALEPAIASGAIIAFITCAGGAFGKVLAEAGVGDVIKEAAEQWGLSLLVLAYLTATLIRIAQGSATVAMITTAGIIAGSLKTVELAYHPVYLVAAIGFGATGFSWMNDSGFWIFGQMTGLSERQTLKTWSALLTIMSVVGFVWTLILIRVLPLA